MFRKFSTLTYAAVAYALAIATLVYIVGFLADFAVPKGISDGAQTPVWQAAVIDLVLIGLFGLHHSITARTSFKRWWTKIIPAPIERATYLYMTAAATALLVVFWQPIPITIWELQNVWAVYSIHGLYLAAWAMMTLATFHFGHFGFFGLAQAWNAIRNAKPDPADMTARYLYALVRHPISVGWMLTPLLVPHFTVGHLVFAVGTLIYILIATPFEEADLIEELGERYTEYRKRVPAFVPFLKTAER